MPSHRRERSCRSRRSLADVARRAPALAHRPTTRSAQRSACGCSVRLRVSLPITQSSVGPPDRGEAAGERAVRSRHVPSGATSSPRRPGATRVCPRATRSASRPPCPAPPGRAGPHPRRRRSAAHRHRVQERGAVARHDRAAAQMPQIDAPRRDEGEQLGGVDRRRPECDPLQLGGQARNAGQSRRSRARRRRAARPPPDRGPARRARAPRPDPVAANPAPTASDRRSPPRRRP